VLNRLGAALAVAVGVVLAGTVAAVPAVATVMTVAIRDYAFSPEAISVMPGTTLTWTNYDVAPHTVTGVSGPAPLSSPELHQGQSWSYTFERSGTYRYYCAVHPSMIGTVVVAAPDSAVATRAVTPVPAGARASVVPAASHPTNRTAAPPPAGVASPPAGGLVSVPVAPSPAEDARPFLVLAGVAVGVAGLATLAVRARPH